MTTIIKNGTIVTADLTYKADVRIEGGVITEIGPNLSGGTSVMLANHHITKPVLIGEIKADGQFDTVWKTKDLVAGDAWSKHLPDSKDLIGDWVGKKCGNYNTETKACLGDVPAQ